jgi:hypothetical protein
MLRGDPKGFSMMAAALFESPVVAPVQIFGHRSLWADRGRWPE